jgi:exodeoxyribonuclease III
MLKILSWNVNGLRACLSHGLLDWMKSYGPDILGLQETKVKPEQVDDLDKETLKKMGYEIVWNPADRPGYSGTILFSKLKPAEVQKGFGIPEFDNEGRIIITKYQDHSPPFTLMNIYYPNGQMSEERLDYKFRFYDAFLALADDLKKKGENLIMMGDFNTAHREIDLKNPKQNEKYSGFLTSEREWIDKFISHGYQDTFRSLYPEKIEYSWWTYRMNARMKNIGWRIDYVFVNDELMPRVKDSFILTGVAGSDHCPVGINLD